MGAIVIWMLNGKLFWPILTAMGVEKTAARELVTAVNSAFLLAVLPILFLKRRSINYKSFLAIDKKLGVLPAILYILLAAAVHLMCRLLQLLWYAFLRWAGFSVVSSAVALPGVGIDGLVLAILLMAVAPAISEEIMFRGFLLRSMGGVYGERKALFVVAALFCLMHRNIGSMPTTFANGLAIGYIAQLVGNCKAGMLMHFVHNSISIVWGFVVPGAMDAPSISLQNMPELTRAFIAFAVGLCMAILVVLALKRIRPQGSAPVSTIAIPLERKYDFLPFYAAAFIMLCFIFGG